MSLSLPFRGRALLLALLAGCSTAPYDVDTRPGPWAEIPVFALGDPRVNTAGFIRDTLRLDRTRGGQTYTLMAFAVGPDLTLGAMTDGEFQGIIEWNVGERSLWMPFDTAIPGRAAGVVLDGVPTSDFSASGATFDGTTWLNIELPTEWLRNGVPIQLTFRPEFGRALSLPAEGQHYKGRPIEG